MGVPKTAEAADGGVLQCTLGRTESSGLLGELVRLLAEEREEGTEESARKVKEDRSDVDEEAW